ncbi:hypothetical protein FDP41_001524 [Naegleria fowleri]|uniref:Uncharacterized protein n=1 Tax=Naegleria fowleri TaxID=5763 RepID=A0A6A5BXE9_NAEFO|nr:uncharacterized protein FDP41_001524 [Naegleria fowleri]KAF0979181.1 hypothetical protein FDP41_001524 [Naegleria fowleri]
MNIRIDSCMLHSLERRLERIEQQANYISATLKQLNAKLNEYIRNEENRNCEEKARKPLDHSNHLLQSLQHHLCDAITFRENPSVEKTNNPPVEKDENTLSTLNQPTPSKQEKEYKPKNKPRKTRRTTQAKKQSSTDKAKPKRKTKQKNKLHDHTNHGQKGKILYLYYDDQCYQQFDKKRVMNVRTRKKHLTLYWIQDCSPPFNIINCCDLEL